MVVTSPYKSSTYPVYQPDTNLQNTPDPRGSWLASDSDNSVPQTKHPVTNPASTPFQGIVTKSAKGVYQNPLCLPPPHLPKIHLADKANAINNVTAPTKAVNPALK